MIAVNEKPSSIRRPQVPLQDYPTIPIELDSLRLEFCPLQLVAPSGRKTDSPLGIDHPVPRQIVSPALSIEYAHYLTSPSRVSRRRGQVSVSDYAPGWNILEGTYYEFGEIGGHCYNPGQGG